MSRIAKLTSKGLKARDFEHELGALNLLLGPVGSGKSTVLEAIRFAALGYCPAVGKSEAATACLMRGDEMSVEIVTDAGERFARMLARKDESLRQDLFCSWLPPKAKATEIDQSVQKLFGASSQEAAEHLDLRELLQCSPNERAKRIEKLLDPSGGPVDELVQRARALVVLRLGKEENIPPDIAKAGLAAAGKKATFEPAQIAAVDQVAEELAKLIPDSITKAEEELSARQREMAKDKRQKDAALKEIKDRDAQLREAKDAVEDLQRRRDETLEKKSRAQRDIETWAAAVQAKRSADSTLPGLRATLAAKTAELANVDATTARAMELRNQANAFVDPAVVVAPTPVAPDAAQIAEADRLAAESDAIEKEARAISVPAQILTLLEASTAQAAGTAHAKALESPWREVEAIADGLESMGFECQGGPLAKAAEFLKLRELAKRHGGDASDLERARNEANEALQKAQVTAGERDVAIKAAKEKVSAGLLRASELRTKSAEIRRAATEAATKANEEATRVYREAARTRAAAVEDNRRKRDALMKEARGLEQNTESARIAKDSAEKQVREIEARLAGIQDVTADPEVAQKTVADASTLLTELDGKIAACKEADARSAEMKALMSGIERAKALADAYSAAIWTCQKLRKEDLAARSKGIEGHMRTFLRGAGRPEEPYIRADKAAVTFGWRNGPNEIAVEALSGGETVLFVAAMAAAVIAMRKPPIRVLLIEGAELGAGGVAEAMFKGCEAVASELDNVVIATNAHLGPRPGWNVINVSGSSPETKAA